MTGEGEDDGARARELLLAGACQAMPLAGVGLVIAIGVALRGFFAVGLAWLGALLALACAMGATRMLERWALRARVSRAGAIGVAALSAAILAAGLVAAIVQHRYASLRLAGQAGAALDRSVLGALRSALDPTMQFVLVVVSGPWVVGQILAVRGRSRGLQLAAMGAVAAAIYGLKRAAAPDPIEDAVVAVVPFGPVLLLLAADGLETQLPAAWARWRASSGRTAP